MASESQQRREVEPTGQPGADRWTIAAAASVGLALYTYFVNKDRELGIFVGLWAPTILAFGNYFKHQRIYDAMNRVTERGGVLERVEKIVQGPMKQRAE